MTKDIGEAKVIHTIFGKAKVRVIRVQDKKRRAWSWAVLVLAVVSAVAWQGWIASQQAKSFAPPPISATIRVSEPDFKPDFIPPATTPAAVTGKPKTLLQAEINSLVSSPKSALPQPLVPKPIGPVAVKPILASPLLAGKPQTLPLAESSNALQGQANLQQPIMRPTPIQPAASTGAAAPAKQLAASSPEPTTLLAPPIGEAVPIQPASGDNQSVEPVNKQP